MNKKKTKEFLSSLLEMMKQVAKVNDLAINRGCVDGTIIGTGRSDYTRDSEIYELLIRNKKFALIDIPGIEGDESLFENVIKKALDKAHVIFYVNGSGKKIEKDSLVKINKYMHDGTSVYSIFNVHCKAKKERIPGFDMTYSDELKEVYRKQKDIIRQTEAELKSFLGKNYKGSIDVNGLLGFCALAFDDNRTTIREETDKNLRKDQKKYLKEYNMDRKQMLEDSHFLSLCKTIEDKADKYEEDIYNENLKKLSNRMKETIDRISFLKDKEETKINDFINTYNEFENNCYYAKEEFIGTMRRVGIDAATEAFDDLTNILFDRIEIDEGKTDRQVIQNIVDNYKDDLVLNIERGVNGKIAEAQLTFTESIADAQERLKKDFERNQIKFEVSLSSENINIDPSFLDALKYSMKDFGKHAFTVGSLVVSGALAGTAIPGLGTVLGAVIGGVLGIFSSIWNFFVSKDKRINNAKAKIRQAIDDNIEKITNQLNTELNKMAYEEKVNNVYNDLCTGVDEQKEMLKNVKKIIYNIEYDMKTVLYKIS